MTLALIAALLAATPLPPPDAEVLGPISFDSLEETSAQLGKAMGGDGKKDVVLRISSPGGSAYATLLWIQAIQDMKARNGARITCLASVAVWSAAFIIYESPVCDRRVALPATVFLAHGVSSGTQGKVESIEDDVAHLRALDEAVAQLIHRRVGFATAYAYLDWIRGHDRWIAPNVLREMGGLDELLEDADTGIHAQ